MVKFHIKHVVSFDIFYYKHTLLSPLAQKDLSSFSLLPLHGLSLFCQIKENICVL